MRLISTLHWVIHATLPLQTVQAGLVLSPTYSYPSQSNCRYLPGDAQWPSLQDWARLNSTVAGKLLRTVPLASPCHDPTYDEAVCSRFQDLWAFPNYHEDDPTSVISPLYANASCDPYTPRSSSCLIGNYPDYSINVSSWKDVAAGLKFAQEKNIRLIIKNTGHEQVITSYPLFCILMANSVFSYLGKSIGKGSLSLWTHNLNSIEFLDYKSTYFTGKAAKIGAGVRAFEIYEAANAQNVVVVGGDCSSIGLAGGYTQGGGHSVLSSLYGLGADQVLEWEVVTAQGQHLIATADQNSDLYWALCGGGPGTYGVVVSLIIQTHPSELIGGARLAFTSTGISDDTYWDAIAYWQSLQESLVDAGTTTVALALPSSFSLSPFTAPGESIEGTTKLLAPFTSYLTAHNISFSLNVTSLPFIDHYQNYFGPFPFGSIVAAQFTGGRLIPRSVVRHNNIAVSVAFRKIVEDSPFILAIVTLNVGHPTRQSLITSNAVLPAWRDALFSVAILPTWNYTGPGSVEPERANLLTNVLEPSLKALTPGSGTYLNEGNFQDPDWKEAFYGSNYDALRAIKKKYDHDDLFYAPTAVGSDAWLVAADGRLCRTWSTVGTVMKI